MVDKKGRMLFRYMCDKLGEKTETHFEGCRVGELESFGETKKKDDKGERVGV